MIMIVANATHHMIGGEEGSCAGAGEEGGLFTIFIEKAGCEY